MKAYRTKDGAVIVLNGGALPPMDSTEVEVSEALQEGERLVFEHKQRQDNDRNNSSIAKERKRSAAIAELSRKLGVDISAELRELLA